MTKPIKSQSLKKNFVFQALYQIVILVIPLVVSPYLTRKLGDTSLGIYSYTYSIAYYFVIFAMLGISRHGQRVIASRREDEAALRKTFWSLWFVHLLFSLIAIFAYLLFVMFGGGEYRTVYLIQTIYVASALFDITWLFYGLENFKSVVIRNLIIKVAECILIFCLVKSSDDLWIYTLIMSVSLFLGQAVMLPQAIHRIKPIGFGWADVKEHFKPLFVLFVAVAASTLYTVFDKTLLGAMTAKENVAYYEYSNKIIQIPKTVIAVIGTVMFPRACACIAKGDEASAKKYMDYSLHFTALIGVGAIFGLLGISNLFAVLYYGESFAVCGNVIIALSPVILIVGLGDIVRTQYLIPNHKDKTFVLCLVLNAAINLVLSIVLIPYLGIYGAVVGTLAAELFGLCFQLFVSRKFLPVKKVVLTMIPYAVFGAAMFGIIYVISLFFNDGWFDLLLQILVGGGIYCILCGVYLFFASSIRTQLKSAALKVLKRPFRHVNNNDSNRTGGVRYRDIAVDYLKILGTLLVILAHVTLPDWLKNIRIFDVVLLVFISAISFSYSKPITCLLDYFKYVWKRIKRLVFVCWIYISVYLIWLYVLNCFGAENDLSLKALATTYTLIGGVGYVWIIRIYLCMALIAPILRYLSDRIKKEWIAFPLVIAALAVNSLLVWAGQTVGASKILDVLLNTCLIPIWGYGVVYFIGMRFVKLSGVKRLGYCALFAVLIALSCIYFGFETIQSSKYPPGILYLSYGLGVSCLLYLILSHIKRTGKAIKWLANNSLGLYFNHIFMIALIEFIAPEMQFLLFYAITVIYAVFATFAVNVAKKGFRKMLLKRRA